MIKIGILGCGNMGGAILKGWSANSELGKEISVIAYDLNPQQCAAEHVSVSNSAVKLAQDADWLLLALKPQHIPAALKELAPYLQNKLLISVAAGLEISALKEMSGGCPVIRVMPNTPALVSQGIFGICFDDPAVNPEQSALIQKLFGTLGETYTVAEANLNAFMAISGCGPAYIYYLLDSLIEAGVTLGFPRHEATSIIYSLAKGSVALAEQSGQPITVLREQVCSPAGTTIAAMNHLDRTAVRGNIVDAVLAACEKGKNLG